MKTSFVDTNLFVRYLTNDDPQKAERVDKLLAQAGSGKILLITAEIVLAEVIWVLESAYGLKSPEIAPLIRGILATPGLEVTNASLVERALSYYERQNIDFIDGYIAALMEKMGTTEVFSFNKKHSPRIEKIRRVEP